jgi:hypothetical protein
MAMVTTPSETQATDYATEVLLGFGDFMKDFGRILDDEGGFQKVTDLFDRSQVLASARTSLKLTLLVIFRMSTMRHVPCALVT